MNIKEYLALGACNGLKIKIGCTNRVVSGIYDELGVCYVMYHKKHATEVEITIDKVKPICFTLDQLTKPIKIKDYNDGEPFVPIEKLIEFNGMDEIGEINALGSYIKNSGINFVPFCIVGQLIKWHFAISLSDDEFVPVIDEFNPYK